MDPVVLHRVGIQNPDPKTQRNKKMVGEAKKCEKTWNCEGEDKCREKCKTLYNGDGICDLYTAPLVPKQCFCHYDC
ncbi:putative defensin-like protein 184 [Arabidopsis lyrata subsp. lyrata]|uniref:putative defensin-like protein 184 n=1 Tax=Arabidopsis lyrata subsp. lyrata TaxID=81972 RepID=UPI000A29AE72|nr:putative defensin-like protein 184 [Arabidopsis lyrata subsp. lyrata]|eukprot:XP_020886528.1 putative defensin-like protein 184 [Arabidopsis lyrata subsp. lyrata]